MNLHFDQPLMLLLALAIVPMVGLGWRWLRVMDPLRRVTVLGIRSALLAILAVALAGPRTVREHDHLTVIGILDISGSVKRLAQLPQLAELADGTMHSNVAYLREWFRRATHTRTDDDRFGLIVFDGKASVVSVPEKGPYIDDNLDVTLLQGTNIAGAIELALAMFPADTSRRIVLLTDGSETAGDAIAAARQAAAGGRPQRATGGSGPTSAAFRQAAVPIDVIPITYSVRGDVQVLRVEAPPRAQAGQTITVRIVLEATRPTHGRLLLQREGQAVDLNGQLPGDDLPLIVLAHSLGGHIMSNHIWDMQHPGGTPPPGLSPFERMHTLAGMVTFGCNIPLFTFAYATVVPIEFPAAQLPNPGAVRDKAKWLNYYDPDDVLGYPLKSINAAYDAVVDEDIPISVGGWFSSWNPLSHNKYWTDNDFTKPAAEFIATFL